MTAKVAGDPDQLEQLAGTIEERSRVLREMSSRIADALATFISTSSHGMPNIGDPVAILRAHSNSLTALSAQARKAATDLRKADSGTAGTAVKAKISKVQGSKSQSSKARVAGKILGSTAKNFSVGNVDAKLIASGAKVAKSLSPQSTLTPTDIRALAAWWQDRQHHDDTNTLYRTLLKVPGASLTELRARVSELDWKAFTVAEQLIPPGLGEAMLALTSAATHSLSAQQLAETLQDHFAVRDPKTLAALETYLRYQITTAADLSLSQSPGAPDAIGQNGWFLPGLKPAWWAKQIVRTQIDIRGGSIGPTRAADAARALVALFHDGAHQLPNDYDLELLKLPDPTADKGGWLIGTAIAGLVVAFAAPEVSADLFVESLIEIGFTAAEAAGLSALIASMYVGAVGNEIFGVVYRAIVDTIDDKPNAHRYDDVLVAKTIQNDAFVGGFFGAVMHTLAEAYSERVLDRATRAANGGATTKLDQQVAKLQTKIQRLKALAGEDSPELSRGRGVSGDGGLRSVPSTIPGPVPAAGSASGPASGVGEPPATAARATARWGLSTTSSELNSADVQLMLRTGQTGRFTAEALEAAITELDKSTSALPQTTTIYRSTNLTALNRQSLEALVGKTVTERGFLDASTTAVKSAAGELHWTIEAPAGTNTVELNDGKLLVERGTQLKITAAIKNQDGTMNLHAKIVDVSNPALRDPGTTFKLPKGFASYQDYVLFSRKLRQGLIEAGYPTTEPILKGSSVTGFKYTTGVPFDESPKPSDLDFALTGDELFAAAQKLQIPVRKNPMRTVPLTKKLPGKLGLQKLLDELTAVAGRDVNFMIYESYDDAFARHKSTPVPR